jgi:hypothetical protein
MSLFNHINIGDIQNYVYLEGTIKSVYLETTGVVEAKWDTADVEFDITARRPATIVPTEQSLTEAGGSTWATM